VNVDSGVRGWGVFLFWHLQTAAPHGPPTATQWPSRKHGNGVLLIALFGQVGRKQRLETCRGEVDENDCSLMGIEAAVERSDQPASGRGVGARNEFECVGVIIAHGGEMQECRGTAVVQRGHEDAGIAQTPGECLRE